MSEALANLVCAFEEGRGNGDCTALAGYQRWADGGLRCREPRAAFCNSPEKNGDALSSDRLGSRQGFSQGCPGYLKSATTSPQ